MNDTAIEQDVQDLIERRIAAVLDDMHDLCKQTVVFIYGYKIHIAYSLMGTVKSINVAEDGKGVIADNDETSYIVDRLWEELG